MGVPPVVVRARGPLAVEAELVAALRAERDAIRADPRRLAASVVIAVPSEILRVHVTALAARELGALAGVRVQTLAGLAHEVVACAGEPRTRGAAAAGIVRRAARDPDQPQGEAFAAAGKPRSPTSSMPDSPDLARPVLEEAAVDSEGGRRRLAASRTRGRGGRRCGPRSRRVCRAGRRAPCRRLRARGRRAARCRAERWRAERWRAARRTARGLVCTDSRTPRVSRAT